MEKHAFHSRKTANTPQRMFLKLPNGTVTEEYFDVVFSDSDQFQAAKREYRNLLVANQESKEPVANLHEVKALWLISHAVVGWSFTEDFNREAVEEFLVESPQNASDLDDLIYNRSRFFGKA